MAGIDDTGDSGGTHDGAGSGLDTKDARRRGSYPDVDRTPGDDIPDELDNHLKSLLHL